ncbi:TonB-dependent receptor [Campylobacter gracilis]|uniref:TonB-dependent receptor n=1 Tax=Campylobacter gracilis RM3268 TaxID=553220 RepID=C8PHB2_9BACT|nr:TonB-dependent receptor [Campylobacter gracilis]EEV17933.1 TonB-dependent receptor [Campylobacter gracilis RM3268]UEB46421.1 TonB-dependent receptor [Campylobacter gracilis]SUW78198.1 putative TonB dependent receptor [Campylobacter gracilis]
MDLHLGGYVASIEADVDLDNVFLEHSLSYSKYTTSRYFDDKDGLYEYRKSNIKNWGNYNFRGATYSYQGGLNDIRENQKNLSYKFDASLKEFEALGALHAVKSGFEFTSQRGSYEVLTPYVRYSNPSALPAGYVCASGDKTCINDDSFGGRGQFLKTKDYYGDVKNTLNLHKISLYIEDEMRFGKFKIRPGARIEKDSFNNDINIAPRLVSEYEFLDKNFLGFGLNRYYGRNFFAYKIFNDMQAHYKTYTRTAPNQEFTLDESDKNNRLSTDLKTPYDDELSLFYRGDIQNARLNLKYVKRKSKNEVVGMSRSKVGLPALSGLANEYYVYMNKGRSNTDITTFSIQNIEPLMLMGIENDLEFSVTYTHKKKNFSSYTDIDIDDPVYYEGSVIKKGDLPVIAFYTPVIARLGHNINFSSFNISNFITYTGKTNTLISGYDRALGMRKYSKFKLPSYVTWDMRVGFEQKIAKDLRFFTNLTINNILNKKHAIEAGTYDGKVYYDYDLGRNFWLEAGVRW